MVGREEMRIRKHNVMLPYFACPRVEEKAALIAAKYLRIFNLVERRSASLDFDLTPPCYVVA